MLDKIKSMFQKRGGMDSAKEDAEELKDVATSDKSVTDKAKDAAAAVQDPGSPGDDSPAT